MKLKNLKLIIIMAMILSFVFAFNACYAVDLNLSNDLTVGTNNSTSSNTNASTSNSTNSSTGSDDVTNSMNTTSNSTDSNSTNSESNTSDTSNSTTNDTTTSSTNTSPKVTSTLSSDDGLGVSDILNIFLIVIGVLLILLSIAILIRLKK